MASIANPPPHVSCIMPTHGRRPLVVAALYSFLMQDYPAKELVVVDDGEDNLGDLFDDIPADVIFMRPEVDPGYRYTIGRKRNLACQAARGSIICHMDSDDLSACDRISRQVHTLISSRRSITGYHTMPLFDLIEHRAYRYHLNSAYCCGASLCYWREFWQHHPFPDQDEGEDLAYATRYHSDLYAVDGSDHMVVLLHDDNISSRRQVLGHAAQFPPIALDKLPPWFMHYAIATGLEYPTSAC